MSNVLILKNDRAGDLFTSIKLISSIIKKSNTVKIYLSELNSQFSFLFQSIETKNIKYDLKIINKIIIFMDILTSNYDKIYILSPKGFYFYLPFIFRNIKFYGIVYDGKKRDRPNKYLRKFLYKFKTVSRRKINKYSYKELQEQLLDDSNEIDDNYSKLNIPEINIYLKQALPKEYIFFQFRYKFFEDLDWTEEKIILFLKFLNKKYEYVLFCSDIDDNKKSSYYESFFLKNFSIKDLNTKNIEINNNFKNIFYLKKLSGIDMFHIIKYSTLSVSKEGLVSHISFFHKKRCHNLFNFKIFNKEDINHQKIGYSEWCNRTENTFSFLNKNFDKSLKKLNKFI